MDQIEHIKKWIKRPLFQGLDADKQALIDLVQEFEKLKSIFDNPIAWAKINSRGDLFDLRLQYNPYETNVIPLYLRPDHAEQRQQAVQSQS